MPAQGGVPQWLPFFGTLAERYELLVPEHPGFGGSDDPPWIRVSPRFYDFPAGRPGMLPAGGRDRGLGLG